MIGLVRIPSVGHMTWEPGPSGNPRLLIYRAHSASPLTSLPQRLVTFAPQKPPTTKRHRYSTAALVRIFLKLLTCIEARFLQKTIGTTLGKCMFFLFP